MSSTPDVFCVVKAKRPGRRASAGSTGGFYLIFPHFPLVGRGTYLRVGRCLKPHIRGWAISGNSCAGNAGCADLRGTLWRQGRANGTNALSDNRFTFSNGPNIPKTPPALPLYKTQLLQMDKKGGSQIDLCFTPTHNFYYNIILVATDLHSSNY